MKIEITWQKIFKTISHLSPYYGYSQFDKLQKQTLDRTMYWHDILSDWIDEIPENIPVNHYNAIQNLRRDIGHFRIELMKNNMERLGHNFNEKQEQ